MGAYKVPDNATWCVLTLRACIEFQIAELYNNDDPSVYLEIL